PLGDVYACPFAIHEEFKAGNVLTDGGFGTIWRESDLFTELREPQTGGACGTCDFFDTCRGGCMAAKFFTGLPLDGPDPECIRGFGEEALNARPADAQLPRPSVDHSRRTSPRRRKASRPVPVSIGTTPPTGPPVSACDDNPLAGFRPS
ncbi:MAG TPA: SPASM domain-containing protein, partial [Actinomycetaceae bacterium]|nr:SPASM domain-containing protein [Actinomycetaceae bacterium]